MAFTLTDTDVLIIKVLLKDGRKSFRYRPMEII